MVSNELRGYVNWVNAALFTDSVGKIIKKRILEFLISLFLF